MVVPEFRICPRKIETSITTLSSRKLSFFCYVTASHSIPSSLQALVETCLRRCTQASALEELRRLLAFMNHSVAAASAVAPTPTPIPTSILKPAATAVSVLDAPPISSPPTASTEPTETLHYDAKRSASCDQDDDDEGL